MPNRDRRRALWWLASSAVGATDTLAQRPGLQRVGILSSLLPVKGLLEGPVWKPFVEQMRADGHVLGQNVEFELRSAEGRVDRLPALAKELVQLKPDLLVSVSNPPLLALKDATTSIPIVMLLSHAAVEVGLVSSLGRPGGNVTGVDSLAPELDAKRLELLRELKPKATRLAAVFNPDADPGMRVHLRLLAPAAQVLGFGVKPYEVRQVQDFDPLFAALAGDKPDALLVLTDNLMLSNRARLAEFALAQRVPSVFEFGAFVDAGGLISYGAVFADVARRAAGMAHRILQGTRPSNIPVELPTSFESALNLKTARALGIDVPRSIALRMDRVIE